MLQEFFKWKAMNTGQQDVQVQVPSSKKIQKHENRAKECEECGDETNEVMGSTCRAEGGVMTIPVFEEEEEEAEATEPDAMSMYTV